MLPYKLRPPVFGNTNENRKRKSDGSQQQVAQGGGPVQQAISQDLENFRHSVVDRLQIVNASDWKVGDAFRLFKELFGTAKLALLHLLLPHPRCDKEAYAQIIYAACLELFRTAMLANNLQDASISIMILFALYETNPLARTESMTPTDYLPNKWKDSRGFRRAFRQRIRIDREHFLWLMRLHAQCGVQVDLSREQETLTSLYGLAQDTMKILDRLFSHWEFCEYTGPVGLEAMAGHPEYPYQKKSRTDNGKRRQTSPPEASTRPLPVVCAIRDDHVDPVDTDDSALMTMMKDYQVAIQSIQLGNTKTPLVSQLRKSLEPVLPKKGKSTWSDIMGLGGVSHTAATLTGFGRRQHAPTSPEDSSEQESLIDTSLHLDNQKDCLIEDKVIPYRLVLPETIPLAMQDHLQNAFKELIQREGTDFLDQIEPIKVEPSITSDVSTLGDGGVSVATGQGRMALQNLLSSAKGTSRVPFRVSAVLEPVSTPHQKNIVTRFLEADGDLSNNDDDNDDDASSVVSNLSLDSDLDQEEDEASVATSAMGKRALHLLLSKVSKDKKVGVQRNPKRTMEKERPALKTDQSLVSSIGAGGKALKSLFQQAGVMDPLVATTNKRSRSETNKTTSRKRGRTLDVEEMPPPKARNPKIAPKKKITRHEFDDFNDNKSLQSTLDEGSTASSIGPGGAALGMLLKKAQGARQRPEPKARVPTSRRKVNMLIGIEFDKTPVDESIQVALGDQSIASSVEPGKAALAALLNEARAEGRRPVSRRRVQNTRPGESHELLGGKSLDSAYDNSSIVSSIGQGGQALSELLEQADAKEGSSFAEGRTSNLSNKKKIVTHELGLSPDDSSVLSVPCDMSVASSIGPGRAALDSLLKNAGFSGEKSLPSAMARNSSAKSRKSCDSPTNLFLRLTPDGMPITDSCKVGESTHHAMLKQAEGAREIFAATRNAANPTRRNTTSSVAPFASTDDESLQSTEGDRSLTTCSSIGPGKTALSKLLDKAQEDDTVGGSELHVSAPDLLNDMNSNLEDEESVESTVGDHSITSSIGPGGMALGTLLKKARDIGKRTGK